MQTIYSVDADKQDMISFLISMQLEKYEQVITDTEHFEQTLSHLGKLVGRSVSCEQIALYPPQTRTRLIVTQASVHLCSCVAENIPHLTTCDC